MKRVLLTGGTGFVGANLARHLLRQGHELHLLVRPAYDPWRIEEIQGHLQLHVADSSEFQSLEAVVSKVKPEWIFHLAAHGAYSWQKDVSQIFQTNLCATVHLLEAAVRIGFEAFIHAGSSSEYGFKDHAPQETEWLEPNSHYACSKAAATQYCRYSAQLHDAHIATLRLYSVYGPYEDPNRLIPKLIEHGLRGEYPPLVAPETARDFVYVEDVCRAFVRAAEKRPPEPGAVYNLGTGKQLTLGEVVKIAQATLKLAAAPAWSSMAARSWDSAVWVSDPGKIQRELGWKPTVSFEQGFLETLHWHRSRL